MGKTILTMISNKIQSAITLTLLALSA